MLLRHRRYFALLSFVLLATPLFLGIFRPDSPGLILKEGRMLAPAPQAPRSWEALRALPGQVDAYLKDHFGLRQMMIRTHRDLSHPVLYGNESVLIGRNGRMFYLGREMVRQSAGLVLRDRKVAGAADLVAAMRWRCAAADFSSPCRRIPRPSIRTIFRSGRKIAGGRLNTISPYRISPR